MYLKNKVAVITGSARGIGKAVAETLAKNGARIVISDLEQSACEQTAEEIAKLGVETLAVAANVVKLSDCEELIKKTIAKWGKVDIMVNNAGITKDNLLMRMKEEEWDAVIAVNLKGVYNSIKAVIRPMLKQRSGRIINMASVVGIVGNFGQANYSASKGGVIALTRTSARELASRGVTVNAIAPGFIETEMTNKLSDQAKEAVLKNVPLGAMGKPEDIAHAVSFFASDEAKYITGQVLCVDGGMVMA